jgi:translation initiation factor RLI1
MRKGDRHHINKKDSQLDIEQKSKNQYFII